MKIIGIDPGIGRMGWGVIEASSNSQKALHFGCIETSNKYSEEKRIEKIFTVLTEIFTTYKPEVLAIEEMFFSKNVTTAFTVGHARGIALLVAAQFGVSVAPYNPGEVKVAVTGYGKADKKQIAQMVKVILKLKEIPKLDDTTDALAIALTHAFSSSFAKQR
jgi:crossover junction endodeoxyribonuclease RuvC